MVVEVGGREGGGDGGREGQVRGITWTSYFNYRSTGSVSLTIILAHSTSPITHPHARTTLLLSLKVGAVRVMGEGPMREVNGKSGLRGTERAFRRTMH